MKTIFFAAIGLFAIFLLPISGPLFAKKKGEEKSFAVGKCLIFFEGLSDLESLASLKSATVEKGLTFKTAKGEIKISDLKLQQQKERWINTLLYLGYLDAKLSVHIDDDTDVPKIDVLIRAGSLYEIKELEILVNEGPLPEHLHHFVPRLPCIAKTPLIQDALAKIVDAFQSGGYPFAKVDSQSFDVIGSSADLKARVLILTGPFCLFGNYTYSGAVRVSQPFIAKCMRILPNEPFDLHQVEESRKALEESGLFDAVTIDLNRRNELLSGPCFIDLDVALVESKCRSFGVGLSKMISTGINQKEKQSVGIRAEWSHRNLNGMGESINLNALYSKPRRNVTLQYAQPVRAKNPLHQTQLRVTGSVEQDRGRSYNATSWSSGIYLDHQFSSHLNFSKGLRIEQIATGKKLPFPKTSFLALPLSITWSSASDLFDPREGINCSLLFSPIMQWSPKKRLFTKQEIQLSRYLSHKKVTLALLAQFANFWNVRWTKLPPSMRYFLGSANEMRGYAYKSLSPLDEQNRPVGGIAAVVLAVEPRIRLHPLFTLVPFVEWGRVYSTNRFKRHQQLFKSTGLGAYINTPIGPLRIDFATPLNRRKNIDRRLQIYMSLGSAF